MKNVPGYLRTYSQGTLGERIKVLESKLNPCVLCPRQCRVNRLKGELGRCKAPRNLVISSAFPHFGEETPLVGSHGSGTIFLTHCNLRCLFCQNYEISIYGEGVPYSYEQTASVMLQLQERGCHNINFVTPTHYVPQILRALTLAVEDGLRIPLVYNCGGYESLEVLRLLEGIVDVYMPDIKFLNPDLAGRFCGAPDYPDVVKSAIREMQRQVGDLAIDDAGLATKGLLIRHLVMPGCGEDTKDILRFIREEVSGEAFVNIMAQYHPCHRADNFKEISRRPSLAEYHDALAHAEVIGLRRAANH
jgi:putative pyruvate formate lyase activating enzyme